MADPVFDRLTNADITEALAIQSRLYPPALVESEAVFLNRISLSASYCLCARKAGEMVGYLLAHGWRSGSPPPIGTVLDTGTPSEILYIHDLAVSPAGRGLALGRLLVERAFAAAAEHGLREAQLVAVEGAHGYWSRLGFGEPQVTPELKAKLATYGEDARWMTRSVPPVGGAAI